MKGRLYEYLPIDSSVAPLSMWSVLFQILTYAECLGIFGPGCLQCFFFRINCPILFYCYYFTVFHFSVANREFTFEYRMGTKPLRIFHVWIIHFTSVPERRNDIKCSGSYSGIFLLLDIKIRETFVIYFSSLASCKRGNFCTAT